MKTPSELLFWGIRFCDFLHRICQLECKEFGSFSNEVYSVRCLWSKFEKSINNQENLRCNNSVE